MTYVKSDAIPPLEAVVIIVATFGLLLFVGALFFVLFGNIFASPLSELLIAVLPVGYMFARKIHIRNYVGAGIKPKTLLLGIGVGASLFLFDILISNLLVSFFGPSQAVEESNKLITDLASSTPGLVSVFVTLILAGVCEELAFRGFLLNAIERKYSFGPAVLISSLAFGLFHFDTQFVYTIAAFLMGLLLGYAYHRWHSYSVCAVAHATIDIVAVALTLLIR